MLRRRHRFALALASLCPLALAGACDEDDPTVAYHGPDAGQDATQDATQDGKDAGPDQGPFGERVPVTGTQPLDGLHAAVNVVRDKYGWVHIFGRDIEDVMRVEGWMMAVDRAGQLELARRLATGRLAELFGQADPGQIDDDITMRTIGLHRVAAAIYAAMDPASEEKRAIDAFADGITQWNKAYRAGKVKPAQELAGMPPSAFTDWTPADSLALARLQTWSLSYDADDDISRTAKIEKVRAVFNATATDPLIQLRAGILRDAFRFDPLDPATPQTAFPNDPPMADALLGSGAAKASAPLGKATAGKGPAPTLTVGAELATRADPFVRAVRRVRDLLGGDEFFGSNNWAVAGSKTVTGNAMVASDPHLGLTSPMVFWPVHLYVGDGGDHPELELEGVAFPGIPGVVLGANRTLAWGATTAGYDVTDVWKEKVTADGKGVSFKGQSVAFEKVTETIKIAGQPDYSWDVLIVPHHGPVVPEIANHQVKPLAAGGSALSVRWTGHAPTEEYKAVFDLARAKDVDDARKALQPFATGAQNWMFADSAGDIFLFSQAKLPYRDKKAFTWDPATFTGTLPCFVLDGEKGEHEWTGGFLEEAYVPKLKTPAKGWIATANTDQIGSTLDNDPSNEILPNGKPFFIGCDFAEGLRLGRIHERLGSSVGTMTLDEMASIQGDHKSGLGARFTKHLVSALTAAEAEKASPGTHPDLAAVVADPRYASADIPDLLAALDQWEKDSQFEAAAGLSLEDGSLSSDAKEANAAKATLVFNAWLVRAMGLVLGDEMQAAGIDNLGTANMVKAFARLLEQDPTQLSTYDPATGQSALWDDMSTPGTVESRDNRLVTAMLDAVDDLVKMLGSDRNGWRWGAVHRLRFSGLVSVWFIDNPPMGDPKFKDGFPRPGDQWNVDACNFGIAKSPGSPLDFHYGSGPVQRFVAEMTKTGPKMRNALPGGSVLDKASPFFANEAELWRRNQNHDVPFELDDVQAAAVAPGGTHTLFTP
jgi:penicillin amidase